MSVDDIRARRAAAEADCGGLTIKPDQYRRTVVDSDGLWVADCYSPEIAVHIAAAPADIDTLLAMVDALTGERDSLRNTLSTACDELRATVAERDALAAQLAQAQRELAAADMALMDAIHERE